MGWRGGQKLRKIVWSHTWMTLYGKIIIVRNSTNVESYPTLMTSFSNGYVLAIWRLMKYKIWYQRNLSEDFVFDNNNFVRCSGLMKLTISVYGLRADSIFLLIIKRCMCKCCNCSFKNPLPILFQVRRLETMESKKKHVFPRGKLA